MVFQLDIRLDADRRQVAAILVDNGYTVKKTTITQGGRKKVVMEVAKEEDGGKKED